MSAYYVYILYSSGSGKYYVGSTEDVERRLHYHNEGKEGAYTNRYKPWELKKRWGFNSKTEALKAEHFIKRQKSRKFIEKLLIGEYELQGMNKW